MKTNFFYKNLPTRCFLRGKSYLDAFVMAEKGDIKIRKSYKYGFYHLPIGYEFVSDSKKRTHISRYLDDFIKENYKDIGGGIMKLSNKEASFYVKNPLITRKSKRNDKDIRNKKLNQNALYRR